jgi:hypothetical protein
LRAEVARKLTLFDESHAMIRDVSAIEGVRVAEIDVERHPRLDVRKHGFKRYLHGFTDKFKVCFVKKHRELSARLVGAISTYHCIAAATLLVAAVILAAVPSPAAVSVALLSAVLLLGPVLLDSMGRRSRELSHRLCLTTDSGPLIVEDTAAWTKSGKDRASKRFAARSQAGS